MRIRSAVAVAALALTAVACGTQPKTDNASGGGDASSTTAGGGASSTTAAPKQTTTTKPKAKVKNQPDCLTYAMFSIGYSGLAFAKPEAKQDAVAKFQVLVDKMKQETPQFAAQIDSINFLVTKQATTPLTPEDKTVLSDSFKPLTEWNAATCVIPPEG